MNVHDEIIGLSIAHLRKYGEDPTMVMMHPNGLDNLKNSFEFMTNVQIKGINDFTYRGLRVLRSTDLKEDEIIVK